MTDTEEGRDRLKAPITSDDFGVPAEWRERTEKYAQWLASCKVNTLARQLAEARELIERYKQFEMFVIGEGAWQRFQELTSAKEKAEARLAEVEKDARRYRWLRDSDESVAVVVFAHNVGHHLDEAIDAAIDAAKERGGG